MLKEVLNAGGKRTMLDLFAENVARDAAADFVRYLGRAYSYGEVDDASRQIAAMLSVAGVGAGSRVAMAMNNRPVFVSAFLGILRLGATAVPLNTFYKPDEFAYALGHADCRAVILEQSLGAAVTEACHSLGREVALLLSREEQSLALQSSQRSSSAVESPAPSTKISREDLAGVFYTSGTTARPKGVMISHGNLMYSAEVTIRSLALQQNDVPLLAFPLFHVNSLFYGVLTAIALGGAIGLLPKFSASGYWEQAMQVGATWTPGITGPLIRLLLQQPRHSREGRHQLHFAVGGTFLSLDELAQFTERFRVRILPAWSMTETVSFGTIHPNYRRDPIPTTTAIGFPTIGQTIRIVRDDGTPVGPGEPGEILYRSPSIFAGYLNDAEASREAFTEDGWLRTGDLAVADSHGYMTFVDRKKDMIKCKGENVSAAEVERVLNEHPDVLDSAVVGEQEAQGIWGESVVAYIVRKNRAEVGEQNLREWTRQKLADFKVPKTIHFVDALPKTPLGKIQRAFLKNKSALTR
jgi:acyl-CoA synthetase (AMP-forming)/AMP-acid ligase II